MIPAFLLALRKGRGQILKALFGYNVNPSLTEVVAYVGYWAVTLVALRHQQTQSKQVAALT